MPRAGTVSIATFLLDEEDGAAGVEHVLILVALMPALLIPAAGAKIMAEYFAYVNLVTSSPFM